MTKRNRFSKCYTLFIIIANKKMDVKNRYSNDMKLAVMIVKEKCKKEFGIKSLAELKGKKLKEFEAFLENRL